MVQMDSSNIDNGSDLTKNEQKLVEYIFRTLGGSNQASISLNQLPKILDPTQLRINNIYFDSQFLNLLIAYAEKNFKSDLSFEQFNLVVSELKRSLSKECISSSMPEASILSSSFSDISPPVELKKRKSLLAARRRTSPFPFYYENALISSESFDDRISQEKINGDSIYSFLANSDPTFPPSRLPHKKTSQKFENSYSKRVSLGFEAYLNDAPPTPSDKNVRRVASELSRKLACEKGNYSNMVQDAKSQILSLESNNVQLKEQIKDLSKTIWQLRESERAQIEAFNSIEQVNNSLIEKENESKKDIKDLKRKLIEKTLSEKKIITELETVQSRATEADVQLSRLYETQKRLKQDKAKLLQTIAKNKRDSDRKLLESHNREQVLLEKIDSLKSQTIVSGDLEDTNLLSVNSSENLLPSSASDILNNMLDKKSHHPSGRIFRKKTKPSTVTLKQNKKIKTQFEKIWSLLEEAKNSLGDSQHNNLQETWEKLNVYKTETCLLLAQSSIISPANKLQLSDSQDISEDYPALSARRGYLNRVMRRRGSSTRLSPKRLSLLLPKPRSNLHKVSSGRNSSQEEFFIPKNDMAPSLEKNFDLDSCLNSDDLVFNKKSLSASSGLIPPFHIEDKRTKRISKESILSSRSGSDFSKNSISVQTNSPYFSEKISDTTDTCFNSASLDESNSKEDKFALENTLRFNKANTSTIQRKVSYNHITNLTTMENSPGHHGLIELGSKDSQLKVQPSNTNDSTQTIDVSGSLFTLKNSQVPLIHNSIHSRCHNCGYLLIMPSENIVKNTKIKFSDLSCFPKKAAIVSETFLEPNIMPEIINPSTSLKTAVYLAQFVPDNNSSDATHLASHSHRDNSQSALTSVTGTSFDVISVADFEIIDIISERCAPCPASWTRDDDDFAYETSHLNNNMNPPPHQGTFLSRSGHFRVYQMGLL